MHGVPAHFSKNIVILVFVNGKLIITGAKTRMEIYKCLQNMYNILLSNGSEKPLAI